MTQKPHDQADRLRAGTLSANPITGTDRVKTVARLPIDLAKSRDPHALASERALLGALFWSAVNAPDLVRIGAVAGILMNGEAMYEPSHRDIVTAMLTCLEEKVEHDPIAVYSRMAKAGNGISGGVETLRAMVDEASTVNEAQAIVYARHIRDAWTRRKLVAAHRKGLRDACDPRVDPATAVSLSADGITEVGATLASNKRTRSMQESLARFYQGLQRGKKPSISTGLRDLDQVLIGLFAKETTVIAARTSVGKSALAAGIAVGHAERAPAEECLYVSLEMESELFAGRLASARSGVPAIAMRKQELTPEQWSRLSRATAELAPCGVHFADETTQTMGGIMAMAEERRMLLAKEGKRLALIVIDHIGLVKPTAEILKRSTSREQHVAETSRGLRFLATRFECHVIALVQINRAGETESRIPQRRHLAESDAIARDADNVIIMHRDIDDETGLLRTDQPAAIVVAKMRSGEPAPVLAEFDPAHVCYRNYDGHQTFREVYGKETRRATR